MNSKSIWQSFRLLDYVQTASIVSALKRAEQYKRMARVLRNPKTKLQFKLIALAYLNRACELACAPIHLRPVETAQGIEMAWYTYRPVASAPIVEYGYLRDGTRIPVRVSTDTPNMAVMLGYESSMTETQARSRAMGW